VRAHENRVVTERRQLDNRLAKLIKFIDGNGPVYQALSGEERRRLVCQRTAMQWYSDILAERILAFPPYVDSPSPRSQLKRHGAIVVHPAE